MFRNRPWKHKLYIGDVWNDDEITFQERGREIIKRIKSSDWYDFAVKNAYARETGDTYSNYEIESVVDEMETYIDDNDEHYFNVMWDQFYDYCDEHRIWVEIFNTDPTNQVNGELQGVLTELKSD